MQENFMFQTACLTKIGKYMLGFCS